jgi:glycerate-2-kinase
MNAKPVDLLPALYRAALRAVDPERATREALAIAEVVQAVRNARRVGVFAVGKGAAGMLRAAWKPGRDGLVVLPRGYQAPRRRGVRVRFSAHPEPDASSVRAARAAVLFFAAFGPEDLVLCLVSGGASSLLCLPRLGVTLTAKKRAVARLVRAGAPISEVNRLRTSLSAVKGGRLGRETRARLVTLVVSDVPGDRASLVGSGPTVRGRPGDVTRVVAANRDGLAGAAREAGRHGLDVRVSRKRLAGEAHDAGVSLGRAARRLPSNTVLLAGGETTVSLGRTPGVGGRSRELALAAAAVLEGAPDVAVLAAGSDGRDGSSRAAGACVDGSTIARGRRRGFDPDSALARHDTEPFLEAAGALIVTGPTGTNVADWAFAVRAGSGKRKMGNGKRKT